MVEHELTLMSQSDAPHVLVPVWCGICEKVLQAEWETTCRRLKYHVNTCGDHAKKLAARKRKLDALGDSPPINRKDVECRGFETALDTEERNLATKHAQSVRRSMGNVCNILQHNEITFAIV